MMFVAGMWFQDLWTYDFRRTEMCIIPYATQMGEISFCAYNTGVGWRQVVEHMHKNATVAEWYKTHGKHAVYANPKKAVPLPNAVPVALKIPRDGRLVDYVPQPEGRGTRFDGTGHVLGGASDVIAVTDAPWVTSSASTSTGASCSRSGA